MGWLSTIMDDWFGMDPQETPPILPVVRKQYLGSFAQVAEPEKKEQKKVRNVARERRRSRGTSGKRTLMIAPDVPFGGQAVARSRTVNY